MRNNEIKQFGSPNDVLIRISESEEGTSVAEGVMSVLNGKFSKYFRRGWIRRQEGRSRIGGIMTAINAVIVALLLFLLYGLAFS